MTRNEAAAILESEAEFLYSQDEPYSRQAFKMAIEALRERKTGKWKTAYLDHVAMGVRPKVLYCSACEQCIAYPTNYCPNCGAKMEVDDG